MSVPIAYSPRTGQVSVFAAEPVIIKSGSAPTRLTALSVQELVKHATTDSGRHRHALKRKRHRRKDLVIVLGTVNNDHFYTGQP